MKIGHVQLNLRFQYEQQGGPLALLMVKNYSEIFLLRFDDVLFIEVSLVTIKAGLLSFLSKDI